MYVFMVSDVFPVASIATYESDTSAVPGRDQEFVKRPRGLWRVSIDVCTDVLYMYVCTYIYMYRYVCLKKKTISHEKRRYSVL